MKKNSNKSWMLIASTLFLGAISACTEKTEQQTREIAPRPVKMITIEDADRSRALTYPATIEAVQSSKLAFQVGGRLEEIKVIAGQDVKQGQVLASLEKRSFNNDLNSASSTYKAALSDYKRGQTLVQTGVISERELEQLKSKTEVAEARLDSAKKALSDSTLIAPYDAIVAAVPAESIQSVKAGQHILTLFGKGQMEAVVNIPSSVVATVTTPAGTDAYVLLEAAPNKPIHATYRTANLEADSASQTYQIKFAFTPPSNLNTLPGMNAILRIQLSDHADKGKNIVSVPTFAIFQEDGKHYVWKVIESTMKVTKAVVTIKDGIGEELMITSGLKAGEKIVGAGANYLTEGTVVRPWTKS